jgi:hypothetical protein
VVYLSAALLVLVPGRGVSMTLLHAVGDAVVGRRDVTLGRHPTESQVRRAAAQCFGIGLDEAVHTPNQSIHHLFCVHAMRVRSVSLLVGAVVYCAFAINRSKCILNSPKLPMKLGLF